MKVLHFLSLFLTLCLCHSSFGKDHVPVLIWNTNQAQGGVPAVSALQYINFATFQAKYLAAFKPNNILLFLQDALSIEDLTSHTSELHHIKDWMETGHSLFLPNVEDAAHLVHDLPAHGYNVLKLDHDAGLSLKQEDKNLVVVELPSTETNPSRRRALQKADEVMENVISKIGNQRDFTIIFTGKKPSVDEHSDQYEQRIRVARSLKATDDKPFGYHQANCTKLYLRQSLVLNFYKDDKVIPVKIPETNVSSEDTGDCGKESNSLHVKYANVMILEETQAKILVTIINWFYWRFDTEIKPILSDTWYFQLMPGSTWILTSASISNQDKKINWQFELTNDMDEVPIGMSFACSEKYILKTNETYQGYTVELVAERFQMEAFDTDEAFDNAWDCVGFFTIPIWCGLLISLLLVIILTIGLAMLSDIKTMDRFDDPKSQPISFASSE